MTTRVPTAVRARLRASTQDAPRDRIESGEYLIAALVALGLTLALLV